MSEQRTARPKSPYAAMLVQTLNSRSISAATRISEGDTMLAYQDFIPRQTSAPGFFSSAEYESFDEALQAANSFVTGRNLKVMNVETVVLPNVWEKSGDGTRDASLKTRGEVSSTWHQFIRVWYER